MKTAGIILFSCIMLVSCSSRNSNNKSKQAETTPQIETAASQEGTTGFQKMDLSYPGSNISFTVKVENKTLLILPSGLSVTNEAFKHDITGYTVTNAEIGDLNVDGYPELFVYLTSDGSGSYGKLIGYSVNNGKSASQVYLPDVAETRSSTKDIWAMTRWQSWKIHFASVSPSTTRPTATPIRPRERLGRFNTNWLMEKAAEFCKWTRSWSSNALYGLKL